MNPGGLIKRPTKIFYGWWVILGGALGSAFYAGVYYYGFSTYFDSLIRELQCSRAVLSGAFSLARLESGIAGPVEGLIVDKFGPRKTMFVGICLMSAGFILLSRINSIVEFYLVFIFMVAVGASVAFSTAIFTAVGNWFVRKRGLAFGLTQSGLGLGGLLVPLVSLLITEQGWRTAALLTGVAVPVVGLPIALMMRHSPERHGYFPDGEAPDEKAAQPEEVTEVRREVDFTAREALMTVTFWLLSLAFAIRIMVTSAVQIHVMPFLLDSGFPREVAASALGSIAFISIAGRLGFGWLGDRISKRYLTAGLLLLLAASLALLGYVKTLWQLIIFLLLYAPTYGGLATLMQSIRGQYFGRKAFGTIMGCMGVVIAMGTVAGPLFAGYAWDITGSYQLAFTVFASAMALAVALILLAKPPRKKTTVAG